MQRLEKSVKITFCIANFTFFAVGGALSLFFLTCHSEVLLSNKIVLLLCCRRISFISWSILINQKKGIYADFLGSDLLRELSNIKRKKYATSDSSMTNYRGFTRK